MRISLKLLILFVATALLCVPVAASSYEDDIVIYSDEEVEIISHGECSDTVADKIITAMLVKGLEKSESMAVQSNILCLFGHSIEEGSLTRIFHNVNEEQPKCLRELWWYEICARSGCEYSSYRLVSSMHTYTCHT